MPPPSLQLPQYTQSAVHGIYGELAGNYQFMDEEYTGRMVIPPRITSSWMKNLLEEWLFRRELAAHRRGIHPEEWISAGNYYLLDADSDRSDHNSRNIFLTVTISGSTNPIPINYEF
jgi:hypothetical protein